MKQHLARAITLICLESFYICAPVTAQTCPAKADPAILAGNVKTLQSTGACPYCVFSGATLPLQISGAQLQGADLRCTDLTGADLSYSDLTSALLDGAKMSTANLTGATLSCTSLSYTDLSQVNFGRSLGMVPVVSADLNCRTDFSYATVDLSVFGLQQFRYLDLTFAKVSNASALTSTTYKNFSNARMRGINLNRVNLSGTNWQGADLSAAVLDGADFTNAIFTNGDLSYVSASATIFTGAHFEGSQLTGSSPATLTNADLTNSKLDGANLSYADFSFANLTGPSTTLQNAVLTGTSFVSANLSGVNIGNATSAKGIKFTGANLANANLKNLDASFDTFVSSGTQTTNKSIFSEAYLCGSVLDTTQLSCANLSNAFLFGAPQNYTAPGGTSVSCGVTTIVNTNTQNATGCNTICPDGTVGPCSAASWTFYTATVQQCCVVDPSNPKPCPNRKRAGATCSTNCDCSSGTCSSGVCAASSASAVKSN